MRFTALKLQNWRNFREVDVELHERIFVVGANASGKSNLLDVFRFLRDIAKKEGGGFQQAVGTRGGVSRLRSLHARRQPDVEIDVRMDLGGSEWRYHLKFGQDGAGRPVVRAERVWKGDELKLERPDSFDRSDPRRLEQTHLEQVNANKDFREIADFFAAVRYLHLVPQLIRHPDRYTRTSDSHDPFGSDFLEQLARMQKERKRTFESRLRRINEALRVAVPQLQELRLERDPATGRPHLQGRYKHWRPKAGWQSEDQFSDGTLRLLGLLWSILDGKGPLLLEEPELSLHEGVVRYVPGVISGATRKSRRQVFISTHSTALLSEESIGLGEVLVLRPTKEDTEVTTANKLEDVRALLEGGLTVGEAVLPRVAPAKAQQLLLKFLE